MFLGSWGFEATTAADGREALQKIRDTLPDLVVCDIQMPVLDGYAVVRALREDTQLATLPVIALTAFAMLGDKEKTLASGFDGYQSKPINSEALRAEINRLLEPGKPTTRSANSHRS
jgi:CheY-like chemotaxis protein